MIDELNGAVAVSKCRHTMVGHCVQGRATGSAVTFLRWPVLWPISSVAGMTLGRNTSDWTAKPDKVS